MKDDIFMQLLIAATFAISLATILYVKDTWSDCKRIAEKIGATEIQMEVRK